MNATIDPRRCVLVLVDYQERLLPAIPASASALGRAVRLADAARELGIRVVGTEENPAGLGANAEAVRTRCDLTLAKTHFDACAEGLVDALRAPDGDLPGEVVIAGCETHVCLLQTALGLLRAGLRVWVVANACGSRSAGDHAIAIERLRDAGAVIVSDEMVLFEWLRSCEHPRFRAVLASIKATSD